MTLKAGRELDTLVEERVMEMVWDVARCRICGWMLEAWEAPEIPTGCVADSCSQRPAPKIRADVPARYSTDIAAALEVLEKLGDEWAWTIQHGGGNRAEATFWMGDTFHEAEAETISHAICLAALKAVE